MIKFKALIHKETGTVIEYEDWKEKLNNNDAFRWEDKTGEGMWQYWAKDILFLDDFEIIYDSEFTESEIIGILSCVSCAMAESQGKEVESILKRIKERYKDNSKIMEEYESIVDEYMFEE